MAKPLILIVEDEPDMANLIAKDVTDTGRYEAIITHNGIEALETLDKNQRFLGLAENRIKCIILDLKMPEMDGLHFIRTLRKKEPFFKLTPVIVLTAYEDEEKLQVTTNPQVGLAAAYLKKPFNKQELIDTIDRVFHGEMGYMIDETREKAYDKLADFEREKKKNPAE